MLIMLVLHEPSSNSLHIKVEVIEFEGTCLKWHEILTLGRVTILLTKCIIKYGECEHLLHDSECGVSIPCIVTPKHRVCTQENMK